MNLNIEYMDGFRNSVFRFSIITIIISVMSRLKCNWPDLLMVEKTEEPVQNTDEP